VRAGSALGIAPPFVMLDVQQHAFAPLMAIWILPGWQVYVTRRSVTVDLRCQGFDKDVKTLTALRVSARGKKKKHWYEGPRDLLHCKSPSDTQRANSTPRIPGAFTPCISYGLRPFADGNDIVMCAGAHGVIAA